MFEYMAALKVDILIWKMCKKKKKKLSPVIHRTPFHVPHALPYYSPDELLPSHDAKLDMKLRKNAPV